MVDLSALSITSNLKTIFIGQRVLYYPSLGSTMVVARQEAQQKAAEGTVIIANEQTAGKGRKERAWLSPRGCIALSVLLYPAVQHLPALIMVASLAVVRSIEAVTGLKSRIKWPNDIILNGRKVCGILIENEVRGDRADYAIIGIGINVNFRVADFQEIAPIAASLSDELGRDVSRLDMVQGLLTEIEGLYLTLKAGGSVFEEWRDGLVTLGRRVQVTMDEAVFEGVAESVGRDGSLYLRHDNGILTKIVAGDVTLRDRG